MALLEFDVIKQYFSKIQHSCNTSNILLSVGDDAAVVSVPEGKELVVCTDTLNEGVHFPRETSAYDIAYKALAVNLSDIAAMGAEPKWFTLNISLPKVDETWLKQFSEGLEALAGEYDLALVGGDTTRGPLSVTITLAGHISKGQALTRNNAKVGDKVFLSGCTGEAAYGLECITKKINVEESKKFIDRLNKPTARIALGQNLVGIANACIDVSDGLIADTTHIAESSHVGINIYMNQIILPNLINKDLARHYALSGGDDYELIFTMPADRLNNLEVIQSKLNIKITCIGEVVEQLGVRVFDENNNRIDLDETGYQHFKE